MELSVIRSGSIVTLEVTGRFDADTFQQFEQSLEAVVDETDRGLIVDCAGLTHIESVGLRVLLLSAKSLARRGTELTICSLSDPVQEILKIAGFDRILAIHDTKAEAVAAVGGARTQ